MTYLTGGATVFYYFHPHPWAELFAMRVCQSSVSFRSHTIAAGRIASFSFRVWTRSGRDARTPNWFALCIRWLKSSRVELGYWLSDVYWYIWVIFFVFFCVARSTAVLFWLICLRFCLFLWILCFRTLLKKTLFDFLSISSSKQLD